MSAAADWIVEGWGDRILKVDGRLFYACRCSQSHGWNVDECEGGIHAGRPGDPIRTIGTIAKGIPTKDLSAAVDNYLKRELTLRAEAAADLLAALKPFSQIGIPSVVYTRGHGAHPPSDEMCMFYSGGRVLTVGMVRAARAAAEKATAAGVLS